MRLVRCVDQILLELYRVKSLFIMALESSSLYTHNTSWCSVHYMILNKPLVRLTTAHYQSAVSMISFAQVLTAQWSNTIPCQNVWVSIGIDLTLFHFNSCFGLVSISGSYGHLADAQMDHIHAAGIGPICKWADNHLFIHIPCKYLCKYNQLCSSQQATIAKKVVSSKQVVITGFKVAHCLMARLRNLMMTIPSPYKTSPMHHPGLTPITNLPTHSLILMISLTLLELHGSCRKTFCLAQSRPSLGSPGTWLTVRSCCLSRRWISTWLPS